MATIKYDVSNVEDIADRVPAPVGVYRAQVVKGEPKQSSNGNQMIEVQYRLTHDGAGKKLKEDYGDVWDYPIVDHEHPFVKARFKEFIAAFGLKPKGALNTDKIVGQSVQVKLKSDTDQDGEYRPRVGKLMALPTEDLSDTEADEDDDTGAEDDGEDELDLDTLDRKALKALIKDEELDIAVKKSMSDDDIREAIAEAMGGDDEDDDEDEDDEDEDEDDTEAGTDEDESDDEDEDGGVVLSSRPTGAPPYYYCPESYNARNNKQNRKGAEDR
jgi:hypothetical protein